MTQGFDEWWKEFSGDKYLPENQFIGIAYEAGAASRQGEIDKIKSDNQLFESQIGQACVKWKEISEKRQAEIDKLEMEIKETQAFLNNQNHIKQTKIDELQKRIDRAMKYIGNGCSGSLDPITKLNIILKGESNE